MNGITLDSSYDLQVQPVRDAAGLIVSGFVVDNTDYQRVRLIVESQKGEFKEYPTLGFGIDNYLKSTSISTRQRFITELTNELKSDGMTDAKITVGSDLSTFEVEL
ncbi:MAG: hypothetical protein ACK5JD_13735 [Mangrovibacterium sp.]